MLLDCLVSSFILGEVGEWDLGLELDSGAGDHGPTDGSAELAKYVVARVHDKGQVGVNTFGSGDQVFMLLSDHPTKQRKDILHDGDVLSLPLSFRTSNFVFWFLRDPDGPREVDSHGGTSSDDNGSPVEDRQGGGGVNPNPD